MDIVIALIGAKGAGKTTAFNAIKNILDVQEITLAAKLKDACAQVFNVPRDYFDSHEFKEKELDDPVFLTNELVRAIFSQYSDSVKKLYPEYTVDNDCIPNKFIRQHVGKVLLTPRQIAQYVGTEVLRTLYEDIHCYEATVNVNKVVGVVTDMRFPNEYDYFASRYQRYYSIYIQNVGAEVQAGKDTHASEAHLQALARRALTILPNNGSIVDFEASVKDFIRTHIQ